MPSAPWKPYCNSFLGNVAAISFDPYSDLLWTASSTGTVLSHFLPSSVISSEEERRLERYTSFKSHAYQSSTTSLIVSERGIISLGDKSIKSSNRRGIPHWYSTHFQDAHSMAFTAPKSIELVVGGAQPELVLINASTGSVVRTVNIAHESQSTADSSHSNPAFSSVTHIRRSQSLLCCASRSGTVVLRDPTTLKAEHSMMAHYAGLEQMESEGNYLVTCGFSLKQGHPVSDPLVKVFDVRALRPLPPITFPSIPAHIRFHPRMSSTLFIASSTGQLQILDLTNPLPSSSFYQLDVSNFITDMCISSSGEGLAYAEADGIVHLWTTVGGMNLTLGEEDNVRHAKPVIKWSRGNIPIELADPINIPPKIDWNDDTPLSSIGMPYYSTELLSVLPYETYVTPYSPLYQPKPTLDPDLAKTIHQRATQPSFAKSNNGVFDGGGGHGDQVHYLPNPKKIKRYQSSLPLVSSSAFSASSATARIGIGLPTTSDFKRRLSVPLFRSEREKEKAKNLSRSKLYADEECDKPIEETGDLEFNMSLSEYEDMPKWYRQVEIKYSKFGIEDFDFGYYNSTKHSGLETHIVNSYTNSLLQVLYHTMPVRKVAESHITMACTTLNCMLCELGFLFKMLSDASGVNCQTSNFSKAFSINQRAIALELMDHQHQDFCLHQNSAIGRNAVDQPNHPKPISISNKSYSSLIQLCHHFLLDQISEDASKVSGDQPSLRFYPLNTQMKTVKTSAPAAIISNQMPYSPIIDLYVLKWQLNQTCPCCHHQTSRTTFTKVIEFIYPRKALSNEPKPMTDFCSILKSSMIRDTTAKSLCAHCTQYTHQRWKRRLDDGGLGNRSLPSVLAINAGVTNSEQLEYWLDTKRARQTGNHVKSNEDLRSNRFLQPEVCFSIDNITDEANANCPDIVIGDGNLIEVPENSICYELRGMILQIQSDDEVPHLVSLIKVNKEELPKVSQEKTSIVGSGWYLFNDFLVKKISEEEALSFPACWKIPCVLYYVRKDYNQVLDLSRLPSTMDQSILLKDINVSQSRDVSKIRHEVLTQDELPKKGDLVAIDAEFVSLQQEEVDYRSDGTRIVRRPSRMTLARVSVLRGEGSRTGIPFIDDHIQTSEPIADYLTEFSGIRPGDLDEHISPHTLVPLKVAYKKLRVLVDLGCIFIGHGLSKDFRIINIYVPPSQIIDTVDLYHIASRQRKLSLRLLSYLILKHDIQNTGMHDSIEDARTALQLYDIYRQFKNEGVWKEELEGVYRKGKELGWKVPGADKSRSPLPTHAVGPSTPLSVASSSPKKMLDLSPISSPTPPPRKFTPSTLSANSATYFPSSVVVSNPSTQPFNRLPPPFHPRTQMSTPLVDNTVNSAGLTSTSSYGPISQNLPAMTSPPLSNFSMGPQHFGTQANNLGYGSAALNTANPTYQSYTSSAPAGFETKKKMGGFNPMAPSFVQSSTNGTIFSNKAATMANNPQHTSTNQLNQSPTHPNNPTLSFYSQPNQNVSSSVNRTHQINEFFPSVSNNVLGNENSFITNPTGLTTLSNSINNQQSHDNNKYKTNGNTHL